MNLAWFRFYEELNDFLPHGKKKKLFPYSFNGNPSVKDAIEGLGVPHVEVDLILINSISVNFSHKLNDGDSVSVYPVFESFDVSSVTRLRKSPLRETNFVIDVHLGKLARKLRLCGFDVYYQNNLNDQDIINMAVSDKRIILTRDRGLLKNKLVSRGYYIRSSIPDEQLREVLLRFHLKDQIKLFSRCMECNTLLADITREEVLERLKPKTRQYYSEFKICPHCDRIYWNGSHYENMKRYIDFIISR